MFYSFLEKTPIYQIDNVDQNGPCKDSFVRFRPMSRSFPYRLKKTMSAQIFNPTIFQGKARILMHLKSCWPLCVDLLTILLLCDDTSELTVTLLNLLTLLDALPYAMYS